MARLTAMSAWILLAAVTAAARLHAQSATPDPATSPPSVPAPAGPALPAPAQAPGAGGPAAASPLSRPAGGDDLTLPPIITAMPGDVRLEPPPEDRDDMLEAVVTGGQTDWRLPDLGTSLHEDEAPRDPNQRIHVRLAPLFDPEEEDPTIEVAPVVDVLRDVGFIRIFEIEIGREPQN